VRGAATWTCPSGASGSASGVGRTGSTSPSTSASSDSPSQAYAAARSLSRFLARVALVTPRAGEWQRNLDGAHLAPAFCRERACPAIEACAHSCATQLPMKRRRDSRRQRPGGVHQRRQASAPNTEPHSTDIVIDANATSGELTPDGLDHNTELPRTIGQRAPRPDTHAHHQHTHAITSTDLHLGAFALSLRKQQRGRAYAARRRRDRRGGRRRLARSRPRPKAALNS
jgi:hypothetical protein